MTVSECVNFQLAPILKPLLRTSCLEVEPSLGHGLCRAVKPVEGTRRLEWRQGDQRGPVWADEARARCFDVPLSAEHPLPSLGRHLPCQAQLCLADEVAALQWTLLRHHEVRAK